MNHVLYEASFKFTFDFSTPIFFMILIPILSYVIKQKKFNANNQQYDYRFVHHFCIAVFAFVAITSTIALLGQIDLYNKTVRAYKNGNYNVVEGYVENFIPLSNYGQKSESFDINGISFSYSDAELQPGYNNAKIHGGVITGDGQHLKIGYVYYNSSYGNIIMYIEELD